jgi:hypothetical protein
MTNTGEQKNYQDGLREGKLLTLEHTQREHGKAIAELSRRMTAQERITWALLGAIALMEIMPKIQNVIGGG